MNSELQINTPIKTNKLTKLERKWYKEYLKCFNATDSLRKAYPDNTYTVDSERSIAYQTKKSVFSKLHIDDDALMDMLGLTEESLYNDVAEGRKATKPIVFNGKLQAVPDYATRHKFMETALRIKGKLTDTQKVELTGKNGEPLSIQLLAGIGFINRKEADENRKPIINIDEGDEKGLD